jgi:hypothetical protein
MIARGEKRLPLQVTLSKKSLRLDVGVPDHLGPFLGLVGNELCEVGRRACERIAT